MKGIIIGASSKSRLIIDFLKNENQIKSIAGLVDQDGNKHGTLYCGLKVISDLDSFLIRNDAYRYSFCISLSENYFRDRQLILNKLQHLGHNLLPIISKTALVSKTARISNSAIIFPRVIINGCSVIGQCVTIYTGALIEHDCQIADNVEISPRAAIAGKVSIGNNTFVGINATILPNINIGSNVIIGAGTVVTGSIESNLVVYGNPARIIKESKI